MHILQTNTLTHTAKHHFKQHIQKISKLVYFTITKYAKYAKLLKNTEIYLKHCIIKIKRYQINGHLPPPCAHAPV